MSGVAPMIAYFFAQVIWLITAFLANAVITLFAFAFNLDLVNGNGSPGSGALTPVSDAIHNLYTSTFGAPWLVVAIVLAGCWAMWKALVQRRYTETAGALAISLLVLRVGDRDRHPTRTHDRTREPALKPALHLAAVAHKPRAASPANSRPRTLPANQSFQLLVLEPVDGPRVRRDRALRHHNDGKTRTVAVRPLSSEPDAGHAARRRQLESGTEVHAEGKTCINDRNKYAPHFLAYAYQSSRRNSEHEALEHGDTEDLPAQTPARHDGSYPLGAADEPAAEAMGKGGQYQRLLLAIVIFAGELGAFLLWVRSRSE